MRTRFVTVACLSFVVPACKLGMDYAGDEEGLAREYLPVEKGLGVFIGNFLILFPACWLLLLFVRRKSEALARTAAWAGTIAGSVAGFFGFWRLVWMLD